MNGIEKAHGEYATQMSGRSNFTMSGDLSETYL